MSEAARSRRIEPAFDAAFGQKNDRRPEADDPLAELARLVGHEDPFRDVFKAEPRRPEPEAQPADQWHGHGVADDAGEAESASPEDYDHWEDASPESYPVEGVEPAHADHRWDGTEAAEGEQSAYDAAYEPAPTTPEAWSSRTAPDAIPPEMRNDAAEDNKAPRRPLVVLFAVLALTGGGLAATFLARSGSSIAASGGGHGAPTILASTTPAKIQQVDSSAATNAEDAESALLSRNAEKSGGAVKVVNSQEQPIDLAQLPKPVASADGALVAMPAISQSPFPEPKKVKTFVVRADGSMMATPVSGGGASTDATPTIAQLAGVDGAAETPSSQPTPRPATPKATSHGSATPKGPPTTVADIAAESTNSTVAKPHPPAAPKPRPVETADAGPTAAASTGNFSLQLAASPSETEAHQAFSRLQKKYSALDGMRPTVKKADTGGKPIYRLRVGSMSQDEAKTLCAQLQAGGGSCFVVRN